MTHEFNYSSVIIAPGDTTKTAGMPLGKSQNNPRKYQKLDQYRFLGNCPPTPPLSQHFALSEKC